LADRPTADALAEAMAAAAGAVERVLEEILPPPAGPERRLHEAMRYAALGAGKRLRPFLVLAAARVTRAASPRALRVGAAVELVHSYSLVHDDLPAMDDDDMRRGRPSCHKAFDEATAILAGDALLTLAFQVLAEPATHPDAAVRCELVRALAIAAGAPGMVGGQMIDLEAEHAAVDPPLIARLERMKTGALIAFSCEAAAILAGGSSQDREILKEFGFDLGLAFQIVDDLLDVEGEEANVGKKVGKDAAAGKATFVSALGVEGARREAAALADRAISRLSARGEAAAELRAITRFVVERKK
jgi:farnesyl diphosphate synthase